LKYLIFSSFVVADGGGVVAALPTLSDSVVERALIAAE